MLFNRLNLNLILAAAMLGIIIYSVFGFLILPEYMKGELENRARAVPGIELQIKQADFNPYTLLLKFSGVTLAGPDNTALFESDLISLNFNLVGLFRGIIDIEQLNVQNPQLLYQVNGEEPAGFISLPADPTADSEIPAVIVRSLIIGPGSFHISNTSAEPEIRTSLNRLVLTADNLSTRRDEVGGFHLTVDDAEGGIISITGNLVLKSGSAAGSFEFRDFNLQRYAPWLADQLIPGGNTGILQLQGEYSFRYADETASLHITRAALEADELNLHPVIPAAVAVRHAELEFTGGITASTSSLIPEPVNMSLNADGVAVIYSDTEETILSLDKLAIAGGSMDFVNRFVQMQSVTVTGGSADWMRNESGMPAWSGMVSGLFGEETTPTATRPWHINIGEMATDGLSIKVTDGSTATPAELALEDIEIQVSNFDTGPGQRGEFTARMNVNRAGELVGSGWFSLHETEVQASIRLAGIEMRDFNPYLYPITVLEIQSGSLAADLNARYQTGSIAVDGRVAGNDLSINDSARGDTVISVDEITMAGVRLAGSPVTAAMDSVLLQNPFVRIEIDADRKTNLSSWIRSQTGPEPEDSIGHEHTDHELPLAIERIEISGGTVDFSDMSLSRHVNLVMDALDGSLEGFTLAGIAPSLLSLSGKIGESGSVSISGRLHPEDAARNSEVRIDIRNMPLPVLSPYAIRFAGRQILAGNMALDLKYLIDEGNMKGENGIVLRNITLGDRVESAEAGDWPLDFAIALLQDRDGRINMNIPVTGNIDNPEFDLSAVLGQAAGNFITGMVSAPFRVLGSIVGKDDNEMNSIPFDPGSAALTPAGMSVIAELSTTLRDRPGLAISAVGSYDPKQDRDALAARQMELHISLAAGLEQVPGRENRPLDIKDPKIREVLDEFAGARLGNDKLAQIRSRHTQGGDAGSQVEADNYYREIFNALIEAEEITSANLERVARYRAQSVVDEFVRQGIETGRVKVADAIRSIDSGDQQVAVELLAELTGN